MYIADILSKTEISKHSASPCKFFIIRDNHSALTCRNVLIGIKAKCADIAKAATWFSLICLSMHFRCVFYNFQIILFCQCKDWVNFYRHSIQMYNHNRFCLRCNLCLNIICFDIPCMNITIDQHWNSPNFCYSHCARNNCKCWQDHFISFSDSQRLYSDLQCCGTIRYRNAIISMNCLTEFTLKFLYE